MSLQTSGVISILNIANEFGDAAPHSMSEFYSKSGSPASGTISLNNFYGLTNGLIPPIWSGNSISTNVSGNSTTYTNGIQVSGNSWRYYYLYQSTYYLGPWQSVSKEGNFSGNSYNAQLSAPGTGYIVSGNNIRPYVGGVGGNIWLPYNRSNGSFSGGTSSCGSGHANLLLQTSGGSIRHAYFSTYVETTWKYGAWITLK